MGERAVDDAGDLAGDRVQLACRQDDVAHQVPYEQVDDGLAALAVEPVRPALPPVLRVLAEHNLLPLDEPQTRLTGLPFFSSAGGAEQVSEVDEVTAPVLPS